MNIKSCYLLLALAVLLILPACDGSDPVDPDPEDNGPLATRDVRIAVVEVGTTISVQLPFSGGVTPLTWAIELSDVPPGMEVEGHTSYALFHGTPTLAGHYEFNVTATDAGGATVTGAYSLTVVDEIDVTGTWSYTMTVTEVDGPCEVGETRTHTLTLAIDAGQYILSGFFDDPDRRVTGPVTSTARHLINLSGSYPEEPGTTTGQHQLTVYSNTLIAGEETWSWTDGTSTCSNGVADVVANRIAK